MKIFILFLVLLFMSCHYAVLEQDVKFKSYINQTYTLRTGVWVKQQPLGFYESLEYHTYVANIPFNKVDSVKKAEYEKAYPYYLKVKEAIKKGKP